MFQRLKNSKIVWSSVFLMFSSSVVGCGNMDRKDTKFLPKVEDRAKARAVVKSNADKGKKIESFDIDGMKVTVKDGVITFDKLDVSIAVDEIKISDADVVGFSSDLQKALRRRMDRARRVRLFSGSTQVIAAATGATLGLMTGDVATAAVFAGLSAIMPELQHIFQAKERSEAYEQGLELMQDADARYYEKLAKKNDHGKIPNDDLD
jgi:hypothetical protein